MIEYVPGGDMMFHIQNEKKLEESHVRFYSAEIILALNFLHSRDIIYRDLKLENVLLDVMGHVKLTDFGICKERIKHNEFTRTICGTPNYTAPEIFREEPYNYCVDYWSLGMLMFELLAGRSAFPQQGYNDPEKEEEELIDNILNQPIRIPRFFSITSRSIIKGFLDKDPVTRLGNSDTLERGLQDIKNNKFFKDMMDWKAVSNVTTNYKYKKFS